MVDVIVHIVKRNYRALVVSVRGLLICYNSEEMFREEIIIFLLGIAFAILFYPEFDIAWFVLASALVFISEILNTAIERLCDLVDGEFSPAIARIKDMGSAAVFLAKMFFLYVIISYFYQQGF